MSKFILLVLVYLITLSRITQTSQARELYFDEPQLYYELLYDLSLLLSASYVDRKFASEKGRDSFPTQTVDNKFTKWIHGENHFPYTTNKERRYDDLSTDLNNTLITSTVLSTFWRAKGHRLGNLMTILHAQETWYFLSHTLKLTVERQRPKYHYTKDISASDTNSFPSGHAGQAFIMAFTINRLFDFPLWAEASIYGLATTSSLLRIAADRHFMSDILMGAALAYGSVWTTFSLFEPSEELTKESKSNLSFQIYANQAKLTYKF